MNRRDFLISVPVMGPALAELSRDAGRRPLFEEGMDLSGSEFPSGSKLILVDAAALEEPFKFSVNGRIHHPVRLVAREEGRNTESFGFEAAAGLPSVLTRRGGMLAGTIQTRDGCYSIRPIGGSAHLLLRDRGDILCAAGSAVQSAAVRGSSKRRSARSGPMPETTTVRMAIFWHPRFEAYVGGEDQARLICQSTVDTVTAVMGAADHTFTRMELVRAENIATPSIRSSSSPDYSSALNIGAALDRFCNDPNIQALRGAEGISIAGFLDRIADNAEGSAYVFDGNPWRKSGMFSWFYGRGHMGTPVHEVGHTFGLNHDRLLAPLQENPYSYGYRDCGRKRRCVMSSGNSCFTEQALLYSDPYHLVDGAAFGSLEPGNESDGARVIRDNRLAAQQFYLKASAA